MTILLLLVTLFTADNQSTVFTGMAMVVAIASFYWRLFPQVRKMDKEGQIESKNYSIVLAWIIGIFIIVFMIGVLIALAA